MVGGPKITFQTLSVLSVLMEQRAELAGAEIRKLCGLSTGTIYPILLRLEEAGWLESRWEIEDPQALGRPRRRYYKVTTLGAQRARVAAREIRAEASRIVSWA